ncbi:MAG: 50S ribosome-binding GTPase, partial [Clostridia bacterium]|nr:50S ribosome-binding GTPase [Clostridia bacterium]
VAWGQLEGKLSREVRRLRKNIVEMLGRIQAGIDFPEEVGDPDVEELLGKLRETREGVKQLLAGAERGRVYSEGVICALCGRPNVGKSTLFNRLLREERAIVTDIPGTTRDVLEGWVNLEGIPVRLLDTAGRRDTADRVEMAGVERAVRAVEDADVVLVVLDAGEGVTEDDVRLLAEARAKKAVVVVNKIDVCPEGGRGERLKEVAPGLPVVWVSAKEGWGMEELEEKLAEVILGEECQLAEVEILVSKVRHKEALERAEGYLEDAEGAIKGGIP